MQWLSLAENQLAFSNSSKGPFVSLSALTHLNLSHNLLNNISHDVAFDGLGSSLLWLNLNHNLYAMNGEPRLLNSLSNLTFLDMSYNQLQSLHRQLFVGLNGLRSLNLHSNHIPLTDAAYPRGVFEPLGSSLLDLRLEGNCKAESVHEDPLFNYPMALSVLVRLESLHMDGLPYAEFGPGFYNMTSLTSLSLSGMYDSFCSLNVLRNETFRYMPSSLKSLNLSECNISDIETDAFRPLRQLDVLDLSSNLDLGFETLGDAFYSLQGSALRELHINSIIHPYAMCVMLTPENTRHFRNTRLETIHARENRLEVFCEGTLKNMPDTLESVTLDGNVLGFGRYFKDFGNLKNLRTIHNDGRKYAFEPPTEYPPDQLQQCSAVPDDDTGSGMNCHQLWRPEESQLLHWIPEVTETRRRGTSALRADKLVYTLPPNLEVYVSRWDKLYYKILDVEFHPNNSLKTLDISNNLITTWIGPIKGLTKLVTLDLANNFAHNVSTRFFDTLTSLKVFNGSRNYLRLIIEKDTRGELFEPLDKLETLALSKNYLNKIPMNVFKGLVSLRSLTLSHNDIFHFEVNITHMKNLSFLDLSFNNIHDLPQFVMDHLDSVAERNRVEVDLTFNPIACTCKHIDFLTWIKQSKVRFPGSNSYSCLMSDGSIEHMTDIFDVIQSLQISCRDKAGILVGAVTCSFCLLVALLSALVYRYRWKLRYLYYASRLAYRRLHNDCNDDFQFDAFVSYSSEDNDFVHGQLIQELETRAGLILNVHNRDFIPGRPIPCNIVDAVQNSRRTLVVLSRELLRSDWCHYEMQMATMEAAHTGRDVLLFLIYEDVPSQEMPREVLYNLQASTYISFPADAEPSLIRDFWDRLAQAIRQC